MFEGLKREQTVFLKLYFFYVFLSFLLLNGFCNEENVEHVGSFIVVQDKNGKLCLTTYNTFDEKADYPSSPYAKLFYVKNKFLRLGDRYTFYSGPDFSPFPKQRGLKIVKQIDQSSFEVLFPDGKDNDAVEDQKLKEAKQQRLQENIDQILLNKRRYYDNLSNNIKILIDSSTRESAQLRANKLKNQNYLVFKDLYIGMPVGDAVRILEDSCQPIYEVELNKTNSSSGSVFQYSGLFKIFNEPKEGDIFDAAIASLRRGSTDHINLNDRLKNSIEWDSRPRITIYFDDKNIVTGFFIPKEFLLKLFKVEKISGESFIELFTSSYNISPKFKQSETQNSVYVSSIPFIFFPFFLGGSASLDKHEISSFIDPRGVRITFATGNGNISSLFVQKWSTPQEIKDSFN